MITYLTGDATTPIGEGMKIIAHIVNTDGAFGAGFVLAIDKKWPNVKKEYWKAIRDCKFKLGLTQFIDVEPNIIVANMCAQYLVVPKGQIPLQYDKLKQCLKTVNRICKQKNATLHGPRFGAGLAGGEWSKIEAMIKKYIDVETFIYDLPPRIENECSINSIR